jgi:hypothetical protein
VAEFEDLPLEHVRRVPLPWRDINLTECGRTPGEHTISRDELLTKVRRQGQKRALLSTCITCYETARRWPGWDISPVSAIYREAQTVNCFDLDPSGQFHDELRAIALLINANRAEFDQILAGLQDTVSLGKRRREARTAALRRGRR